ncbi:MAG: hypothetical protein Ta2D_06540 [Rickettsiales bacterium]|nr:MAG: hypothetical protein Ta2D_06540 [Rickettsiales bacterium]
MENNSFEVLEEQLANLSNFLKNTDKTEKGDAITKASNTLQGWMINIVNHEDSTKFESQSIKLGDFSISYTEIKDLFKAGLLANDVFLDKGNTTFDDVSSLYPYPTRNGLATQVEYLRDHYNLDEKSGTEFVFMNLPKVEKNQETAFGYMDAAILEYAKNNNDGKVHFVFQEIQADGEEEHDKEVGKPTDVIGHSQLMICFDGKVYNFNTMSFNFKDKKNDFFHNIQSDHSSCKPISIQIADSFMKQIQKDGVQEFKNRFLQNYNEVKEKTGIINLSIGKEKFKDNESETNVNLPQVSKFVQSKDRLENLEKRLLNTTKTSEKYFVETIQTIGEQKKGTNTRAIIKRLKQAKTLSCMQKNQKAVNISQDEGSKIKIGNNPTIQVRKIGRRINEQNFTKPAPEPAAYPAEEPEEPAPEPEQQNSQPTTETTPLLTQPQTPPPFQPAPTSPTSQTPPQTPLQTPPTSPTSQTPPQTPTPLQTSPTPPLEQPTSQTPIPPQTSPFQPVPPEQPEQTPPSPIETPESSINGLPDISGLDAEQQIDKIEKQPYYFDKDTNSNNASVETRKIAGDNDERLELKLAAKDSNKSPIKVNISFKTSDGTVLSLQDTLIKLIKQKGEIKLARAAMEGILLKKLETMNGKERVALENSFIKTSDSNLSNVDKLLAKKMTNQILKEMGISKNDRRM